MAIATPVSGFRTGAPSPQLRDRTHQILAQTAQQRPNLPPELVNDQTRLSDELVGEVGKAMETQGGMPNFEAMLGALTENFLDKKAQEQQPMGGAKEVGDKGKKTREAEWKPMVEGGQVISPQGQIGEVTIKEKEGQPNQDNGVKKTQQANKAKGAPSAGKVGAPQSAANAQKNNQEKEDGGGDEKVEFSPESKQMLEKMQGQGMNGAGLDPNQKADGAKGPSEKKQDIFMPSAGMTQAVKVREAGPIKNGDVILSYRKLDDLPSGNIAIVKDKKGKDAVDDYKKKVESGEKVDKLSEEQQRQLLNPTATH